MTENLKEELKKIMSIKGKVRGVVFKTDEEYVIAKKGPKALEKLKRSSEALGYPIDYEKIKALDWYPIGLRVISLLAAQEAFGWGEEEIRKMGRAAPKFSFIVKMLMKYFVSLKRVFETSPQYWKKHYNVGELEAIEFNEKKRYARLRLKNFKIHPLLCRYLFSDGYFLGIVDFVSKSKEASSKEVKCSFEGDAAHECLIRW